MDFELFKGNNKVLKNLCIEIKLQMLLFTMIELSYVLGYSLNALYVMYLGKVSLNEFRQIKGYKTGTYVKEWIKGVEDNEFLIEYLLSSDYLKIKDTEIEEVDYQSVRNNIMQFLERTYEKLVLKCI